jgi:soluble lytic murein transglycosylase-like protein
VIESTVHIRRPVGWPSARTLSLIAFGVLICGSGAARADCLDDAATYFGVDGALVHALAWHESKMEPRAINRNRDGSVDIGLMQINSRWLSTLEKRGISRENLFDPCVNGYVGTWILRSNIERIGPTWKAVGAYNAATPSKQLTYANKIYAIWRGLHVPASN